MNGGENIINCIVTSARGEYSPLQKTERKNILSAFFRHFQPIIHILLLWEMKLQFHI